MVLSYMLKDDLLENQSLTNSLTKVIGVFGSASTQADTPDFHDAYTVGAELARAGYTIMTGGYDGAMLAASQGAHEVGGHVIGVTVGLFKTRGLLPNVYLREEVELPTLGARLNYLILKPDAYVVLRGGVGTLAEMSLAWSLIQVGEIPMRPLVLLGSMWKELIPHFVQVGTINPHELGRLTFVEKAEEVRPALEAWWANPPNIPLRLGDRGQTLGGA